MGLKLLVTSRTNFFIKQTRDAFAWKNDLLLVLSETVDMELIKDVLKGIGWTTGAFYELDKMSLLLDEFKGKIITVKISKP